MIKSAAQSSILNDTRYTSMSAGIVPSNEYLISTTVLDAATPSITFDVSSFVGIYRHLQLCISVRTVESAGASSFVIRFNNDSGNNYSWHHLRGNGSSMPPGAASSTSLMYPGAVNGGTSPANSFSPKTIDILDFSSATKNTTIRAFGGEPGSSEIGIYSGAWYNTAPVTSIFIFASANFAAGSRFSIYGVAT